jgi:hypothetical protein
MGEAQRYLQSTSNMQAFQVGMGVTQEYSLKSFNDLFLGHSRKHLIPYSPAKEIRS